jgi:hypothetical protein
MIKKSLATALLVCAIPAMANASWFLTTQAKNAGGSLTTSNGTQVVTDGVITKSYKNIADQTPSVTPAAGNSLRALVITDSSYNPPVAINAATFTPVDGHSYTVAATFQVSKLAVSASIAGGTVSPGGLGNIYYGYKLTAPVTFTFAPAAGSFVSAISGAPAEATVSALPGGVNQRTTVTLPAGYTFTGALSLQATTASTTPTIYHILPQTVVGGSSATLAASGANLTGSYNWTYVSGPANTSTVVGAKIVNVAGPAIAAFPATGASVKFTTPTTPGQYKFQVTNGSVSSLAVINVVATSADAANQCQFCHTANGVAGSTPTSNIGLTWAGSVHSGSTTSICSGCHYGTGTGGHPGSVTKATVNSTTFAVKVDGVVGGRGTVKNTGDVFCTSCHNPLPHSANLATGVTCVNCHTNLQGSATTPATGDAHKIQPLGCTNCHAIAQTNPFSDKNLAGDTAGNNGVRAVMGEFGKWSHHIVNPNGGAPIDEQCAVCHLEGTVGQYGFGVDGTKHMTDNFIHLRNAQTDADMQWDPANPNHSTMDNFCMSCHSKNGASSSMNGQLQALISKETGITASALNPFGDTISNRYDKMQRPRVTDVDDQFNTTNNSHHAVKGPRYSGRTRAAGPRQIASASTFANNSTALLQGIRSTIYDAGNFNALYTPLENVAGETAPRTGAQDLGDDSTLHCGDCHTVGQWKVGSSKNAAGQPTPAQIGAHGSNNEYMLRNSLGTDERHTQNGYTLSAANVVTQTNPNGAFLVCFNCHAFSKYGSTDVGTGADAGNPARSEMNNPQSHAGEYVVSGRCNSGGNTLSFAGYTTGAAADGTQFMSRLKGLGAKAVGEQNPDFGNIFGIQCLNCHNSGLGNAYGGIHGSANDTDWNGVTAQSLLSAAGVTPTTKGFYIDGMGNVNKVERFLPGVNNTMHVPGTLGGFNGGTTVITGGAVSNDTNWEQKQWKQGAGTVINYQTGAVSGTQVAAGAGCYTLGESESVSSNITAGQQGPSVTGPNGAASEAYGTWGACDDHTAAQGAGNHGFLKRIVRPVTY